MKARFHAVEVGAVYFVDGIHRKRKTTAALVKKQWEKARKEKIGGVIPLPNMTAEKYVEFMDRLAGISRPHPTLAELRE